PSLDDGAGGRGAREPVLPGYIRAVARGEFLPVAVEQTSAELVAERVPHDRVHADQPRREMADRGALHELHVDERRAGAQRERVAVAAQMGGGAVGAIKAREPAG